MPKDLSFQVFGRLLVLGRAKRGYPSGGALWLCRCDCDGGIVAIAGSSLRNGLTKSCGCLRREITRERGMLGLWRKYPPGEIKTPLYYVWAAMKSRCSDPKMKSWRWYGAKGVKVCAAWQEWPPFRDWAQANGYAQGLTIERVDVYGDYEPGNCTWIPLSEQHKNRRAKITA